MPVPVMPSPAVMRMPRTNGNDRVHNSPRKPLHRRLEADEQAHRHEQRRGEQRVFDGGLASLHTERRYAPTRHAWSARRADTVTNP